LFKLNIGIWKTYFFLLWLCNISKLICSWINILSFKSIICVLLNILLELIHRIIIWTGLLSCDRIQMSNIFLGTYEDNNKLISGCLVTTVIFYLNLSILKFQLIISPWQYVFRWNLIINIFIKCIDTTNKNSKYV